MKEALKLALDALETELSIDWGNPDDFDTSVEKMHKAITAIKEALAQPEQEQEPVAWMYQEYRDDDQFGWRDEIQFVQPPNDPNYFRNIVPVYTTPPQRTWVGLEGEEIRKLWEEATKPDRSTMTMVTSFARAIEAKLKQKNGYAEEKNT